MTLIAGKDGALTARSVRLGCRGMGGAERAGDGRGPTRARTSWPP